MIFRSSFSPLHRRATTHVNTSVTFCSTQSYTGETPTCWTPSRARRPPSGSSSGHIFWTTPYSPVSQHVRLRSRHSLRPRTSLCFLRPRGPPTTLPARPALTLGTVNNNNSNRSASLAGPRLLHTNVSPSEARTAPSPNLPLRKGGSRKDKHRLIYRLYVTNGPLVSCFARPASTSGSSRTVRSRPGRRMPTFLLVELAGHRGQ